MRSIIGFHKDQSKEFLQWLEQTPVVYNATESFYNLFDRQDFPKELFYGKTIVTGDFFAVEHDNIACKPFPLIHVINTETKLQPIQTFRPKRFYVSLNGAMSKVRTQFVDFLNTKFRKQGWISYHDAGQVLPSERNKANRERRAKWLKPQEYWLTLWDFSIETGSQKENFIFPNITEKIWLPLKLGKPFCIFGHSGSYTFLQNYGFELYDEIIDYSFDSADYDDQKRFKLFTNEIKKLIKQNEPLSKETQEKIKHNKHAYKKIVREAEKQYEEIKFFGEKYSFLG